MIKPLEIKVSLTCDVCGVSKEHTYSEQGLDLVSKYLSLTVESKRELRKAGWYKIDYVKTVCSEKCAKEYYEKIAIKECQ